MSDIVFKFVEEHVYLHLVLIALSVASLLGAMTVDFLCGIKKAKERGEATISKGYRKTSAKAAKYMTPMLALVFIDLICCVIIPLPAFTMLWAAYCIFCEFVSVREKAWKKAEIQKAEKTMSVIIENKDDIARLVADMLFKREGDKV